MNTTLSRRKLAEAAFFLGKIEKVERQLPDFNYYLSAYFSAARSVSWILKAEYSKESWFSSWHASFNASADEEDFMKIINSIRIRTEKHEPVDAVPTLVAGLPVHESVPEAEAKRETVVRSERVVISRREDGGTSSIALSESAPNSHLQGIEFRIPEFPNYDITYACRRYFAIIERLVSGCEAQHVA